MQSSDSPVFLSVYIFTFVTGLPTNMLAFYTFSLKVRQKPAPIDILLLNLTVSDLIFLTFLPFRMQEAVDGMVWKLPYPLCPLSGFVFYTTIYNSIFFLTAVSVERYLGVAFPIRHKLNCRPLYAVVASIFFWVFSFLQLSIVYIIPYYHPLEVNSSDVHMEEIVCYENFTKVQLDLLLPMRLEFSLVLFCIPFVICCYCYINFIHILLRLPLISRRRRLRAIGLALVTLLVFALCFGPYNVSHVVGFVIDESPDWRNYALLFSTFNACIDPFIFYFSSAAVRKTLRHLLAGLPGRLRVWDCYRAGCCPSVKHSRSDRERDSKLAEANAL